MPRLHCPLLQRLLYSLLAIAITDHGEFFAFFGNRPYGVPSPIEQNNKHILILKRLFDSGAVPLPTRLGFTLKPDLKSLVLVSKGARISRPKKKFDGLDCIIKNDQLFKTIDKAIDDNNNVLLMAKIVGQDTLQALARDVATLHRPIQFNWTAKSGLPETPPAQPVRAPEPATTVVRQEAPVATALVAKEESAQSSSDQSQKCYVKTGGRTARVLARV